MKPITELTDYESNQRLTYLRGGCWHSPIRISPLYEYPVLYQCEECGLQGVAMLERYNKPYATSYDAIIPVIQGMDDSQQGELDEVFTRLHCKTPRQLLDAVIVVLENKNEND